MYIIYILFENNDNYSKISFKNSKFFFIASHKVSINEIKCLNKKTYVKQKTLF